MQRANSRDTGHFERTPLLDSKNGRDVCLGMCYQDRTMKEFTAAFHSEVFRPIVTLVVPGFFATSTISLVAWQRIQVVPGLADSHPGTTGIIMFLLILSAGLVLEDLGARLEHRFDRSLCSVEGYEHHSEEWYEYLRLAFTTEPVGHRYLRSLVLRMKFELGMAIASIPFGLGALALEIRRDWHIALILVSVAVTVGLYFGFEAKSSNKELSKVRRELLEEYRHSPNEDSNLAKLPTTKV